MNPFPKTEKINLIGLLLLAVSILSGCSSMIHKQIINPSSYDFYDVASKDDLIEQGYEFDRLCEEKGSTCIDYLRGKPFKKSEFKNSKGIRYNLVVGDAPGNEVNLFFPKEDMEQFSGTIIILHGYRGSKEFMTATGLYFRALGLNVIIPDLFGHGDSEELNSFGVKERFVLSDLVDSLPNTASMPIFVFGHSMGSNAALSLTNIYKNKVAPVAGLILAAPMNQFDQAIKDYYRYQFKWTSKVYEPDFKTISKTALTELNLNAKDTDAFIKLNEVSLPTIVYGAKDDVVSPASKLQSISNQSVSVEWVENRNHPSLALISGSQTQSLQQWLSHFY